MMRPQPTRGGLSLLLAFIGQRCSEALRAAGEGGVCQQPAAQVSESCPAADDFFSLAEYALDRRNDADVAVRHYGPNMAGPEQILTYGEVKKAAYFAANLLADHGIRKGDTVLVLGWNSFDMVAAYWGAHYLGAVVPAATPTHGQRKYLLKYTGARAVVAPRAIFPELREEIDDRTHVKLVLLTDSHNVRDGLSAADLARPFRRPPCRVDVSLLDDGFEPDAPEAEYRAVVFDGAGRADRLGSVARASFRSIRASDEALWYFTSGTTGKPKGCTHRQVDLAFAAETYGGGVMQLRSTVSTATDVMMAGPYAMGSNLVFPFVRGASVFLDHRDKLSPANVDLLSPANLRKARANVLVSIPLSISRLARELFAQPRGELAGALKTVSMITSAGAALPTSTYVNFQYAAARAGLEIEVLDGIGTSELQHIFISNFPGDVRTAEGSVGRVVPGYEAKLLNRERLVVGGAEAVKGELMVRTVRPDIGVRYATRRQPKGADYAQATEEVLVPASDGGAAWYLTGDVAFAKVPRGEPNNHTWFYLLGRKKDLATQIGEGGGGRGMGLEDYVRKAGANAVLQAAGLYQDIPELARALDAHGARDVLATDVYPIKLGVGSSAFVVSVSATYWPAGARMTAGDILTWSKYISARAGVSELVFVPTDRVPRTAPPLLKPKPGDMKAGMLRWLRDHGLSISDVNQATCAEMSPDVFV